LRSQAVRLAGLLLQRLSKCLDVTTLCRLEFASDQRVDLLCPSLLPGAENFGLGRVEYGGRNCGDGKAKLSSPCRRRVR
jgi:hypothetical protein